MINHFDKNLEINNVLIDPEIPNICPICRNKIHPDIILHSQLSYDRQTNTGRSEVVFHCTNDKCNSLFICRYEEFGNSSDIIEIIPPMITTVTIPKEISIISPAFHKIYEQANIAFSLGLDEICGVGYRKSIEFLVKDYLKSIDTEEYTHKQIETTTLRNCIRQWVPDPRIKGLLERSTIIGNDETHYTKKYEDRDINYLQSLINITIHFISMEFEALKIENEFPI